MNINRSPKALRRYVFLIGTTCAMVSSLSACGDKVLDFRNAQVNNGKVYASDSDTPFSGKLTNVPVNSLLASQQGVQRLASFVGDLGNAAPYGGAVPYSLCDASIRDGKPDGEVICKPEQSETAIVKGKRPVQKNPCEGLFTFRARC